jgi:hypothetical protein
MFFDCEHANLSTMAGKSMLVANASFSDMAARCRIFVPSRHHAGNRQILFFSSQISEVISIPFSKIPKFPHRTRKAT